MLVVTPCVYMRVGGKDLDLMFLIWLHIPPPEIELLQYHDPCLLMHDIFMWRIGCGSKSIMKLDQLLVVVCMEVLGSGTFAFWQVLHKLPLILSLMPKCHGCTLFKMIPLTVLNIGESWKNRRIKELGPSLGDQLQAYHHQWWLLHRWAQGS